MWSPVDTRLSCNGQECAVVVRLHGVNVDGVGGSCYTHFKTAICIWLQYMCLMLGLYAGQPSPEGRS